VTETEAMIVVTMAEIIAVAEEETTEDKKAISHWLLADGLKNKD